MQNDCFVVLTACRACVVDIVLCSAVPTAFVFLSCVQRCPPLFRCVIVQCSADTCNYHGVAMTLWADVVLVYDGFCVVIITVLCFENLQDIDV